MDKLSRRLRETKKKSFSTKRTPVVSYDCFPAVPYAPSIPSLFRLSVRSGRKPDCLGDFTLEMSPFLSTN